jgi:protein TonB
MFSTLETTLDRSSSRGWTTFASFTFQALALSLLLLIPLFSIQGPPRLEWFQEVLAPPPAPAPPAPVHERVTHPSNSNMSGNHVIQPASIPDTIAVVHETSAPDTPNIDEGPGVPGGTGTSRNGVMNSLGPAVEVAPPAHTAPTKPVRISHWSEGNLVYRVKPVYPPIAVSARIQGQVQLRAIISKTGTIENLVVENGPPMLIRSAIEAVKQWRYRPYILNDEPIEVETEITVNFTLGGS